MDGEPFKQLRNITLNSIGSFAEIRNEGFSIFSLGPLYVYAGIQVSLPDEFVETETTAGRPKEVSGTTLHFGRPVVARCEAWNRTLNVMDTESYQWFKRWMIAQQFANRQEKKFYVSRHFFAPMLDPIILDTKGASERETLDVFCPSGMRGTMRPIMITTVGQQVKPYVDFSTYPPEEDVVILGNAALTLLKGT